MKKHTHTSIIVVVLSLLIVLGGFWYENRTHETATGLRELLKTQFVADQHHLDLRGKGYTSIPDICSVITPGQQADDIWSIDLGNNEITSISVDLSCLKNLSELNLGFNKIKKIQNIAQLTWLNKLDLGNGNPILVKGNTDAFVAKVDKTGANILYAKTYGAAGSTLSATRVAVDSGGNAVFLGTFNGSVNFGFGGPTAANAMGDDAYLLRVSSAGASAWVKTFGNAKKITFNDVKIDGAGNSVLVGSFQGTISIGTKMLSVPGAGTQSNPFVAQLAVGGTTNWALQLGNTAANPAGSSGVSTVGIDAGNNIMIAGLCYSAFDLGFALGCAASGSSYLLKMDSAGAPLWGKAYTGGALALPTFTTAPFAMVSGNSNGALDLGKGAVNAGMVVTRIATK
mgnify:CR=1 FL=1